MRALVILFLLLVFARNDVLAADGKPDNRPAISCSEIEAHKSRKKEYVATWKDAVIQAKDAARLYKNGRLEKAKARSAELGALIGSSYDNYNLARAFPHVKLEFSANDAPFLIPPFVNAMYRQIYTDQSASIIDELERLGHFLENYIRLRSEGYAIQPDPFTFIEQRFQSVDICEKYKFPIFSKLAVPMRRWFDKNRGTDFFQMSEKQADLYEIAPDNILDARFIKYQLLAQNAARAGDPLLTERYFAATAKYMHLYRQERQLDIPEAESIFSELPLLSITTSSALKRIEGDRLE